MKRKRKKRRQRNLYVREPFMISGLKYQAFTMGGECVCLCELGVGGWGVSKIVPVTVLSR